MPNMEVSPHPHRATTHELRRPWHSRVRGPESGVSNPKHSNQARDRFATFQPGMSLKNKEVIRRSRDASEDITENKRDSLISGDIFENKGLGSSRPAQSKALRPTLTHSFTVRQPGFDRVGEQQGNAVINFSTFQPGMCMKTKDEEGVRCQVRGVRAPIPTPDSTRAGWRKCKVQRQKSTFQPGMCMKTNDTVRSPKSKGFCGRRSDSASWLLATDSCDPRNEGASGDVVENKGGQKERCQVSGVRCQGRGKNSRVSRHGPPTPYHWT